MARAEGAAAKIAADASELGRALDAGQSARLTAARALSGMYVATAGQIPQWLPPARALRRASGWRDPAPRHPVRQAGEGAPSGRVVTTPHCSTFTLLYLCSEAGRRAGHRQKIHVVGCLMAGCLVAGSLVRGEVRTGRAKRARRVVRANAERARGAASAPAAGPHGSPAGSWCVLEGELVDVLVGIASGGGVRIRLLAPPAPGRVMSRIKG